MVRNDNKLSKIKNSLEEVLQNNTAMETFDTSLADSSREYAMTWN